MLTHLIVETITEDDLPRLTIVEKILTTVANTIQSLLPEYDIQLKLYIHGSDGRDDVGAVATATGYETFENKGSSWLDKKLTETIEAIVFLKNADV